MKSWINSWIKFYVRHSLPDLGHSCCTATQQCVISNRAQIDDLIVNMTTRDTFITRVISAIATKATPENADLASRAFNSLHYDFPVRFAYRIP